jgi:hypothetical protein
MRSDEMALEADRERNEERSRKLNKGIKTAVGIGTSLAGGGLASKIAPFLNTLIPEDLAMKGISKISPKIGHFLEKGKQLGLNVKEGFDYLKSQIKPKKDNFELISGYEPELTQFINDQIGKGINPKLAASSAKQDKKFTSIIKKIEKDTKKTFEELIEEMFGGQSFQLPQPSRSEVPQSENPTSADIMQLMGQPSQSQVVDQQATNGAPGKQGLMNTMQQMSEIISRLKGK